MNKSSIHQSAGVSRKFQIKGYLKNNDFESLVRWTGSINNPLRTLSSLLFDIDPLIQWRAIEAMGLVAADIAQNDKEPVRRQIRRLFWLMNDESGGLCWNAPEAIAEIIVNVPDLAGEYVPNLFSYMDEEPFEAGMRWAVYRLTIGHPDKNYITNLAITHRDKITKSLAHENPRIRAFSILALKSIELEISKDVHSHLMTDKAAAHFYNISDHTLRSYSVHEFFEILK